MTEHVYVLTGRIIPERAILQVSEIRFLVAGGEDVPQGGVSIEIVNSQVFATYKSQSSVKNIFTLRNIIEDAVRLIADVAGFWQGYGYDVEIVQMLQPATGEKYVYGID